MTYSDKDVSEKLGNKLLKTRLYPYQLEAVNFHLHARYSINGFTMGLGKTIMALAFCERNSKSAVIVCPAYLVSHWKHEIAKFSKHPGRYVIISYGMLKNWRDILYNMGSRVLQTVVFDEVHYLKNPQAKRTKAAHEMIRQMAPPYMLGLTGTPVKNHVAEWWSLLKLCSYGAKGFNMGHFAGNHRAFCRAFSNEVTRKIGNRVIVEYKGLRNAPVLKKMIAPIYIRKKAVGLPDRVAKSVVCSTPLGVKLGTVLEEEFQAAYSVSEAKKQNATLKVDFTAKLIEEFLAQDIRPVVFSDHVLACKRIAKTFGVVPLTGETPPEKRAEEVQKFEDKKTDVLVCTIGAMSTGFSITSTNHMIINDYPWVPADLAQAEGRIRRVTQKKTCFYHYVFASEMDQMIYKTLEKKVKIIKEVTEI